MPSTLGITASGYYVAPFSPLDLSPAIWLDASDTATITASSGSVSQWDDKSGNGRHFTQSVSASQPVTGAATQNGLNLIRFAGTDDFLERASNYNALPYTYAIVYSTSGTNNIGTSVISSLTSSPQWMFQRGGTTTTQDTAIGPLGGTDFQTSSKRLFVARKTSSAGATGDGYRINRASAYTYAGGLSASLNLAFIGRRYDGNYFTGDICEIVVYPTALSSTDVTSLETYLKDKWGTP